MKTAINLRAYGQRNPLNEYKREAFILFESLLNKVREKVTELICQMQFQVQTKPVDEIKESHPHPVNPTTENPFSTPEGQISRNAPCPCGSGKKYKHCCGAIKD